MKRGFFYALILTLGLTCPFVLTSCDDDDDETTSSSSSSSDDDDDTTTEEDDTSETDAADILYTSELASSWGNYMQVVANLLVSDAETLYADWNDSYNGGDSYASIFKSHNTSAYFPTAKSCIQQLIEGCADIANEVGVSKIGEPYDYYIAGETTQALYAVESWYSWHSREDYRNNIYSIRNCYYGSRDGEISENSLSLVIAAVNSELDETVKDAIDAAAEAIWAIPSPFRNNIASDESVAAMEACATLEDVLSNELWPYIRDYMDDDDVFDPVVTTYVDDVVLPTYEDLVAGNTALYEAVVAFAESPSDEGFEAVAEAWLTAREPWETSEAFLFGPVADEGLDPNMDSWPLDQEGIVNLLESGNFDDVNWEGEYDEDNEEIAAAQNLRGYHTLEFLAFRDGEPRSVTEGEE